MKEQWCIPAKANADFVCAMEDVLEVYHRPQDPKRPLVCFDEGSKQQTKETRSPLPPRPGDTAKYDYEYERNGTSNLFVFLAPVQAWRHIKVTDRRTMVDFAHCMRDLVDIHFPEQNLRLDDEWRQAEKALQQDEDAGKLIFNLTPGATMDDVWDKCNRFHGQIAIFHYGGHSNKQALDLTDKQLKGKSLATLLGQEPHLKLVFLNGCSNAEQVNKKLKKGIPAVIATTENISDRRAITFSRQFYVALSSGRTIEEAFSIAAEYVNQDEEEVQVIMRVLSGWEKEPVRQFAWGLYVQNTNILHWKIPEANSEEKSSSSGIQVNNYGDLGKQLNIDENHGDIYL